MGHYTLRINREALTVEDRRDQGNGVDTLSSIEVLDFDASLLGGSFDLRTFGNLANLTSEDLESFIELYIAYFNRAPDAIGLNFWGSAFASGTSFEEMAILFVDQNETRAAYPEDTSNIEFATSVYGNVLGRTPDQTGIDFWVAQLDLGEVSRAQFILEVLKGAKADLKPEEGQAFVDQQLADRLYLENKVDLGAYFAVHRGISDVGWARSAMDVFDGSQVSIEEAVSLIDSYYVEALSPESGQFLMQLLGVLESPVGAFD